MEDAICSYGLQQTVMFAPGGNSTCGYLHPSVYSMEST